MYYTKFKSFLCDITLVGNEKGLTCLFLHSGKRYLDISNDWTYSSDFFSDIKKQIEEYGRKERTTFDVTLNPKGTDFQKKVWKELRKIPYGKVCSYKDIAKKIGNEKASRAVGMANNKNPIGLLVPCHRVIGSNGHLTGYAGGLPIKEKILYFEGAL